MPPSRPKEAERHAPSASTVHASGTMRSPLSSTLLVTKPKFPVHASSTLEMCQARMDMIVEGSC
eukprot:997587-Amphidinium_carterae.1